MNNSYIPNIEKKFEKIIDDFTSNKQKTLDYLLDEELKKNNSSEVDLLKSNTFVEEKEYIKKMLRNNFRK